MKTESDTYQDIIQSDFPDKYKHMTLKQVSVLKYLSEKCGHIRYEYLFKTDDDIVMDLRSISRHMATIPRAGLHPQRTLFCFHMNELAYVPRYADKWFVSPEEFPDKLYPAYCSGAGYLISKKLVPVLYDAALHVASFWVDDTFVSGLLPQAVGDVSLVQIPKQALLPLKLLRKTFDGDLGQQMIVHVQQDLELFNIYWNKFSATK